MKYLPFIAFGVCSAFLVLSVVMFGLTPFLLAYAACAAINIPGMVVALDKNNQ